MNKSEFITVLKTRLKGVSENAVSDAINFYDELICDRMEKGESEEAVISSFGSIPNIVKNIKPVLKNKKYWGKKRSYREHEFSGKSKKLTINVKNRNIVFEKSKDDKIKVCYYSYAFRRYDVVEVDNEVELKMRKRGFFGALFQFFFWWIRIFHKTLVTVELPKIFCGSLDITTVDGLIDIGETPNIEAIKLTTRNGKIFADKIYVKGAADFETKNGRITLDQIVADSTVTLTSINGKILATGITCEKFDAKNINAKLFIKNIKAKDIVAESANDSVSGENIDGENIDVNSASGKIILEEVKGTNISLKTNNSKIDASVYGKKEDFCFDGKTVNAKIFYGDLILFSQTINADAQKTLTAKTSGAPIYITFIENNTTKK